MLRKTLASDTDDTLPEEAEVQKIAPISSITPPDAIQDRLDMILLYLHKMDKRDKWRTRGAFIKSLISLLPIIITVWAAWYFYMYGDILMKKLTTEVVRQSAEYSKSTINDRMQELAPFLENLIPNAQPTSN